MAVAACLLCVGIFALCMNTPEAQRLNADDIAQKKAEIDRAESLVKKLAEAFQRQSTINEKLAETDTQSLEVIKDLQESIKLLGEHVKDSVPTREEVTKLVSAKVEASTSDGECTCGEKLADLQRQIDDLKAKVASLECLPSRTSSAAAAASSYGSASSPVVVSSGGSTGSVKSGGSTGSVVRSSYGSTGSTNSMVRMDWQPVVQSESYSPRWQNHDGLSRAEHAAVHHGLNTAGMTQAQINATLDSDHDRFGPLHDGILSSRTRSVTRSTYAAPAATSNCPGGVCPTGPTATSRGGGLLGFGILGRR